MKSKSNLNQQTKQEKSTKQQTPCVAQHSIQLIIIMTTPTRRVTDVVQAEEKVDEDCPLNPNPNPQIEEEVLFEDDNDILEQTYPLYSTLMASRRWKSALPALEIPEMNDFRYYENMVSMEVAKGCQEFKDYTKSPLVLMQRIDRITKDIYYSIPREVIAQEQRMNDERQHIDIHANAYRNAQISLWNIALAQMGRQRRYGFGIYLGKNQKESIKQAFKVYPSMEELVIVNHLRTIHPKDLWDCNVPDSYFAPTINGSVSKEFCDFVLNQYLGESHSFSFDLSNGGGKKCMDTLESSYQIYNASGTSSASVNVAEPHLANPTYRNKNFQNIRTVFAPLLSNPCVTPWPTDQDDCESLDNVLLTRDDHLQRHRNDRVYNPMFDHDPVGIQFQNYADVAIKFLVYPINIPVDLANRRCIVMWQDFGGNYYCDTNEPVSDTVVDYFHEHCSRLHVRSMGVANLNVIKGPRMRYHPGVRSPIRPGSVRRRGSSLSSNARRANMDRSNSFLERFKILFK